MVAKVLWSFLEGAGIARPHFSMISVASKPMVAIAAAAPCSRCDISFVPFEEAQFWAGYYRPARLIAESIPQSIRALRAAPGFSKLIAY
jgi:hypothetical protein